MCTANGCSLDTLEHWTPSFYYKIVCIVYGLKGEINNSLSLPRGEF